MSEVIFADNLKEWSGATYEVVNGRALAAVYTVTDPETATNAVDYYADQVDAPQYTGWLNIDRLPDNYVEAINRAHDSAYDDGPLCLDSYERHLVYNQGSAGIHYHEKNGEKPLERIFMNLIVRRSVEVMMVPLTHEDIDRKFWNDAIAEHAVADPYVECNFIDPNMVYLPREAATKVGGQLVTLTAGQMIAFSSYDESRPDLVPAGHQFVSVGDTPLERNNRSSVLIEPLQLKLK